MQRQLTCYRTISSQLCQLCPPSPLLLRSVSRPPPPASRPLRTRRPAPPCYSSPTRPTTTAARHRSQEAHSLRFCIRSTVNTPKCATRDSHSPSASVSAIGPPLPLPTHQPKSRRQGNRRPPRVHRQAQGTQRALPRLSASGRPRVPQLSAEQDHGGDGGGWEEAQREYKRSRQIGRGP